MQGKKVFFQVLILGLLSISFSGCGLVTWKDGVKVPDKDDVEVRSKVKVFVDDKATLRTENDFLNDIKLAYAKGVEEENVLVLDESKKANYENLKSTPTNEFGSSSYYGQKEYLSIFNFKTEEQIKIINSGYKNLPKSTLQIDFEIVNRTLVSKKVYKNEAEVIFDAAFISRSLYHSLGKELGAKHGYNLLVLDGNEVRKNRLVFRPLTEIYSMKKEFDKVLNAYGYKVVQSKNEADRIFEVETLIFGTAKYVEKTNKTPELYKYTTDGRVIQSSMDISRTMGNSSGASAGVGLALLALNAIAAPDKENMIEFASMAKFYIKGFEDEKDISILSPKAKVFRQMYNINDKYFYGSENMGGEITTDVESYVQFLDSATVPYASDRVINSSPRHKGGVIYGKKYIEENK